MARNPKKRKHFPKPGGRKTILNGGEICFNWTRYILYSSYAHHPKREAKMNVFRREQFEESGAK